MMLNHCIFMGSIKKYIKNTFLYKIVKKTHLYDKFAYYRLKKLRMQENLIEAKHRFAIECPIRGDISDYYKALKTNLVSYSEYMYQYEFWKLNESERHAYISRLEMRLLYERIIPKRIAHIFWNKADFLTLFAPYIHRRWVRADSISFKQFCDFNNSVDCIVKPIEGTIGAGIFKIARGSQDRESLYKKCVSNNFLIEECISNESKIAQFHPYSLNTIRITSVVGGGVLGAFIRFGRHGSVVDNAHAGGIFAQIDPETGVIVSNGINTDGNEYEIHPDTHVKIKGFEVPRWIDMLNVCISAHKLVPMMPVVGWDVCINVNNEIEIIEGNHMPDVDVLQSPLKVGIRSKLKDLLRDKIPISVLNSI